MPRSKTVDSPSAVASQTLGRGTEPPRPFEFVARVAHELRSPLAVILGWSSRLLETPLPEHERERVTRIIQRCALAENRLLNNLLDASLMGAGHFKLQVEYMPTLSPVVDEVVESMRIDADRRGVTLARPVSPEVGPVSADPDRLRQVLYNLITNALKFTPAGGRVEIACQCAGRDAMLTIRDTGSGIPRESLNHVFEPFWQADNPDRHAQGLGLGLAITREIVELHDGIIDVASDGVGHGTIVTVLIPLRADLPVV
jgi:signal transduction histidine kinase